MPRKIILLLSLGTAITVLVLLVAFWWQIGSDTERSGRPAMPVSHHGTNVAVKSPSSQGIAQPPPRLYEGLSDPRWDWWKQMESKDRMFEGKMAMNFYGKVVDQDDEPVEGAAIFMTWTDISAAGTSKATALTDREGLFALTGRRGKNLGVDAIRKDGYYMAREGGRFSFEYAAFFDESYHQPDPKEPVIFRLRSKGVPEPMIHHRKLFGFEPDGGVSYIDLGAARKQVGGAPTGDLSVRITREPIDTAQDYTWMVTIETMGQAGLKESDEEFMFFAPESGYTRRAHYEFRPGQPNYRKDIEKRFYFRTNADGHYGRLEILVLPQYNARAAIDMSIYVNPSGSRNLEYDGNLRVRP